MIASVADCTALLGLMDGEDPDAEVVLDGLLTRVERMFLAACGRADRPFLPASVTAITETIDGVNRRSLFVSRPIASVTSVVIGPVTSPRQTLTASDLVVRPGSTMIQAVDASVRFGTLDEPGAVTVTYTAAAEVPEDARQAVIRATVALYLQRGAEDVRSESEGGVRSELASPFEDPSWRMAVAVHAEPAIG